MCYSILKTYTKLIPLLIIWNLGVNNILQENFPKIFELFEKYLNNLNETLNNFEL